MNLFLYKWEIYIYIYSQQFYEISVTLDYPESIFRILIQYFYNLSNVKTNTKLLYNTNFKRVILKIVVFEILANKNILKVIFRVIRVATHNNTSIILLTFQKTLKKKTIK